MRLEQIILRPRSDLILVQTIDAAGRGGTFRVATESLDEVQTLALGTIVKLCRDRLPADPDDAQRLAVEREIAELEGRLTQLRSQLSAAPAEEEKPITP